MFRFPPPYLWTPPTPQRVKGCTPLTIPKEEVRSTKKLALRLVGAIAFNAFFASPSIAPQSLRDRSPEGEQAPARSAALSQKAALRMPFSATTTCENGIPERPQTLRYSEIINSFFLSLCPERKRRAFKIVPPESGTALNGNCRRSRPCRRGRRESRSCGSPRGRGGCSGRWGQRPACRQDKPPQRCRPRR